MLQVDSFFFLILHILPHDFVTVVHVEMNAYVDWSISLVKISVRDGVGSPEQLWAPKAMGWPWVRSPWEPVSSGFGLSLRKSEGVCLEGKQ